MTIDLEELNDELEAAGYPTLERWAPRWVTAFHTSRNDPERGRVLCSKGCERLAKGGTLHTGEAEEVSIKVFGVSPPCMNEAPGFLMALVAQFMGMDREAAKENRRTIDLRGRVRRRRTRARRLAV